jgi:hypothetical protein
LDPTNRKVSAEYFWLMQCTRAWHYLLINQWNEHEWSYIQ